MYILIFKIESIISINLSRFGLPLISKAIFHCGETIVCCYGRVHVPYFEFRLNTRRICDKSEGARDSSLDATLRFAEMFFGDAALISSGNDRCGNSCFTASTVPSSR